MPTYTTFNYSCKECNHSDVSVQLKHNPEQSIPCTSCSSTLEIEVSTKPLSSSNIVLPPDGSLGRKSKLEYYGITNIITGEGITKHTDVRDPPGLRT